MSDSKTGGETHKDKKTQTVTSDGSVKPIPASARTKAEAILKGNLNNLAKKVINGGTLSTGDVKFLREAAGESEATVEAIEFAKNQSQLASLLNVSRKTIQRYCKRDGAPTPRPNGSLCVKEWRAFLKKNDVLEDDKGVDGTKAKAEQILIQNDRLRLKYATEKEQLIPKVVAQQVFSKLLLNAKTRSYTSIIRFVTLARLASNTTEAATAVRKEMDEIWQSLSDSKWLK